ncbi:NYN domain-containing protein [Emticicia fluvialis]|nr:NYN domain-containing protein [Emticicia fluvialis]
MSGDKFNIAVLIDGDNAQAKLIKEILAEVSKYGKATIRRIYGDWTNTGMKSWKEVLNQYSINPIQKFAYTTGKNSTDSSLIIDAMDILHGKSINGFCIVSSDSDYTGLAKRIREEGLFVMGIGRTNTPTAFVNSCDIFTFSENLIAESEMAEAIQVSKKKDRQSKVVQKEAPAVTHLKKFQELDEAIIDKAFEISTTDDETYVSNIGLSLRKIDPSFDSRTYGYKTLSKLLENLDKYEVIRKEINGINHPLLRLKQG